MLPNWEGAFSRQVFYPVLSLNLRPSHSKDTLITMPKTLVGSAPISVPPGVDDTHELIGSDPKERFLLDIWRGTIRLSKLRFQNRGRKIVLVRLDIGGAPHTNPDGTQLPGTHLHLYCEGYDDKWAYPIDSSRFRNTANVQQALEDFWSYCNIQGLSPFQAGLT
jgi:hypothetical protein